MTIIHPNQPMPFAIHPFRTQVDAPSSHAKYQSLIANLKNRYGPYCHLSRQRGKRLDVVFHQSPGYLLGEMTWEALGKPPNAIYCETLPQQNQVLLVIIHDGHVYLDTRLPATALIEELYPLSQTTRHYDITIHGKLPHGALESLFPQATISTLSHSLLCQLSPAMHLQLQDVDALPVRRRWLNLSNVQGLLEKCSWLFIQGKTITTP